MAALIRQYFSEQTRGFADGILLLDLPAPALPAPDMREEERQLVADSVAHASKKRAVQLIFDGTNDKTKLYLARHISEKLNRRLCHVSCTTLNNREDGDKVLSRLVSDAQNKQWILFFDEADALFGKRTQVEDSHYKYANQEVSYLLKLITQFGGLAVFSCEEDDATQLLCRRFKNLIHCN